MDLHFKMKSKIIIIQHLSIECNQYLDRQPLRGQGVVEPLFWFENVCLKHMFDRLAGGLAGFDSTPPGSTITITAATRVERTTPRIFTSRAIAMAPSATSVALWGQTYRPMVKAAAEADAVLPTMKTTPATTPTGRPR